MTVISLNYRSESDQKAIREQLDRILNSGPFQQSRRRQRFLEYIVNETLAGRGERLKGYNVALAVFDRPKTFDPAIDPVVRIEAARLREKLREYYETEGQTDPIRIELRKGSYAPHIEFRKPAEDRHQEPVAEPAASADKASGSRTFLVEARTTMADCRAGLGTDRVGRPRRRLAHARSLGAYSRKGRR